jgi:flagellar biosynthetic protein FliP
VVCLAPVGLASAQTSTPLPTADSPLSIPDLTRVIPNATDPESVSSTMQIFVLLTVLTLVPSILIMTTSFARIIVVLALARQALGVPQLPPGQVLMGLSMFITILVMAPTWGRIKTEAVDPYLDQKMGQREALEVAVGHMREFMFGQIEKAGNEDEIFLFLEYQRGAAIDPAEPVQRHEVPTTVVIPAFLLSELKTAFIIGFRVYLPFLVIDMVIASILISMGMMMLPPVLISLPFKLLLFVLADGWHLITGSLLESFARV